MYCYSYFPNTGPLIGNMQVTRKGPVLGIKKNVNSLEAVIQLLLFTKNLK